MKANLQRKRIRSSCTRAQRPLLGELDLVDYVVCLYNWWVNDTFRSCLYTNSEKGRREYISLFVKNVKIQSKRFGSKSLLSFSTYMPPFPVQYNFIPKSNPQNNPSQKTNFRRVSVLNVALVKKNFKKNIC